MKRVTGFPPIAARGARVLILGSMPGARSLERRQYYAHPQNAFWRIMGELFEAGPSHPYAERRRRLMAQGVAVWDVLQHCERAGSLDSAIRRDSEVPNDFTAFFRKHRQLRAVFFNGATAAAAFRRHVRTAPPGLRLEQLPSTSPAHAAVSFARKVGRWRRIREFL